MSETDEPTPSPGGEEMDVTIDKEFVHGRASKITWEHLAGAGRNASNIFNKLETVPELAPFEQDGKLLVAMIDDFATGSYRNIPFYSMAVGVAGLLYLIDPVDVIPDFIPNIGYVDDAQVLDISFEMIRTDIDAYRSWKNS